jgi:hypothetical protein
MSLYPFGYCGRHDSLKLLGREISLRQRSHHKTHRAAVESGEDLDAASPVGALSGPGDLGPTLVEVHLEPSYRRLSQPSGNARLPHTDLPPLALVGRSVVGPRRSSTRALT